MYHIFLQPFSAVEVMKKGSTRAFALMLFLASGLGALAVTLVFEGSQMMSGPMKVMPILAELNTLQLFLLALVGIYVGNMIRAFLIHLVMKIFTDKGTYADAFKVVSATGYLVSVYLLLVIILGAIPVAGLGLAMFGFLLTVIVGLAVMLRGIATMYKTDIITTWLAIGLIAFASIVALHMGIWGAKGEIHMYRQQMMMGEF